MWMERSAWVAQNAGAIMQTETSTGVPQVGGAFTDYLAEPGSTRAVPTGGTVGNRPAAVAQQDHGPGSGPSRPAIAGLGLG